MPLSAAHRPKPKPRSLITARLTFILSVEARRLRGHHRPLPNSRPGHGPANNRPASSSLSFLTNQGTRKGLVSSRQPATQCKQSCGLHNHVDSTRQRRPLSKSSPAFHRNRSRSLRNSPTSPLPPPPRIRRLAAKTFSCRRPTRSPRIACEFPQVRRLYVLNRRRRLVSPSKIAKGFVKSTRSS